jgi:hypothetical protein
MDRPGGSEGPEIEVRRKERVGPVRKGPEVLRSDSESRAHLGTLPGANGKGNNGKLTDVLDHQLRVGDQDVNEKIIAAHLERGLQPPDNIVNPPEIQAENILYWEAYRDLITERKTPRGMIPINSIVAYARAYGLDPDTLKRIIWSTDRILTDHWKGLDDIAKDKAAKPIEVKPTVTGGQS